MATPRINRIATEFIKRIPTTFKTTFLPEAGVAMPDSYLLTADVIMDFVNRALLKLFNTYWDAVRGDVDAFIKIFPELVQTSDDLALTSGNYIVDAPHFDFKALVGAVIYSDNTYIKPWPISRYMVALSERYPQFTATVSEPAIIQVNNMLAIFPQSATFTIRIQYIGLPLDPQFGSFLTQNGDTDSPFNDDWNSKIADLAQELYLMESQETILK